MRSARFGQCNFKSRVAESETGRHRVILGFAAGHGERHAGGLRHDFDACIRERFAFVDGGPKCRLLAGAREHQRTGSAAKLFVLARIVEGDFEHEGRRDAGRRRELSLFKRIGYVRCVPPLAVAASTVCRPRMKPLLPD